MGLSEDLQLYLEAKERENYLEIRQDEERYI